MKKFVKYLIYIIIISILIVAVFNQNTSVGNPGTFENKVNGKTGINSLADDFGEKIIGGNWNNNIRSYISYSWN